MPRAGSGPNISRRPAEANKVLSNDGVWIPVEACDKCGSTNGVAPLFTLAEATAIVPFGDVEDLRAFLSFHRSQFDPTKKIRKYHGHRIRLLSREEIFLIRTMLILPYGRSGKPPMDVRLRIARMAENLQRDEAEKYPAALHKDTEADTATVGKWENEWKAQMLAYLRGETDVEPQAANGNAQTPAAQPPGHSSKPTESDDNAQRAAATASSPTTIVKGNGDDNANA